MSCTSPARRHSRRAHLGASTITASIRRRSCETADADIAAGTGDVLDDHRLAERGPQRLGENTRQRIWDGQDKMLRDDLTWVKGNHLFQFGGSFQNNYDFHTRTDNGSTVNNQVVYLISNSGVGFT